MTSMTMSEYNMNVIVSLSENPTESINMKMSK